MGTFEAIVLGLVQGITEFLPISSTGHLRIVPAFMGWDDPGSAFTAVVQLGTLAAVLIYFRRDIVQILRGFFASLRDGSRWQTEDLDGRMGWFILLGTLPISVFGLLLSSLIETSARDLYVIGTVLVLFSFVMLRAEAAGTQQRDLRSLTVADGLKIGLAQAVALIPGVSRSGATISAGLFLGLDRTSAARYSFLLSIPAVTLAGLFQLKDVGAGDGPSAAATALATLLAFVSGYASIAWLLKLLTRHSIGVFAGYRIAVGLLVLALAGAGAIS